MSGRQQKVKVMSPDDVRRIVAEVLNSRKNELDDLVSRAARSAVQETLIMLGVDPSNPIEAQATFAALRDLVRTFADKDFQADLSHLKFWRRSIDGIRQRGMLVLVSAIATGMLAWVATGFKVSITR